MKKQFFILQFFLLCYAVSSSAQLKISNSGTEYSSFGKKYSYTHTVAPIGFDGSTYFLKTGRYYRGKFNSTIFSVSSDLSKIDKYDITDKAEYSALFNSESREFIDLVSSLNNKKDSEIEIVKQSIAKGNKISNHTTQKITVFPYQKDDNWQISASKSNNGKFKVITTVLMNNNNEFKKLYVCVLDSLNEVYWKSDANPNLKNNMFSIKDVAVTDEGFVYIVFFSFQQEKKTKLNPTLHLIKMEESDISDSQEKISFGFINNAKLKVLKNGNVFFGGFYGKNQNENSNGQFSMTFSSNSNEIISTENRYFGDDFLKNIKNKNFQIVVRNIYETTDGIVTLLGEQQLQYAGSADYFAQNIYISAYLPSGELLKTNIIEKYQYSGLAKYRETIWDLFVSFDVFPINNKLVIIMNDNIKNYLNNDKNKTLKDFTPSKYKSTGATVAMTLEKGEVVSRKILIDCTKENRIYRRCLVMNFNNNEALVCTESNVSSEVSAKFYLEKLTWEN